MSIELLFGLMRRASAAIKSFIRTQPNTCSTWHVGRRQGWRQTGAAGHAALDA